ncbi:MAG: GrpB family protein, partial [Pseudomonadota bacterium]
MRVTLAYVSGMRLTNSITDYDERWPSFYRAEAKRLRPIFGDAFVELHHVGSTAVEGLAAKPEIDILVVVSDSGCLAQWQSELLRLGYRRGGDLMEGHHFFKRDKGGVRTHKLHICPSGHSQVSRMLGIRDHLRGNLSDRRAYAELKLRLERENRTGIAEYLNAKAPFLDDLYRKSQGGLKID